MNPSRRNLLWLAIAGVFATGIITALVASFRADGPERDPLRTPDPQQVEGTVRLWAREGIVIDLYTANGDRQLCKGYSLAVASRLATRWRRYEHLALFVPATGESEDLRWYVRQKVVGTFAAFWDSEPLDDIEVFIIGYDAEGSGRFDLLLHAGRGATESGEAAPPQEKSGAKVSRLGIEGFFRLRLLPADREGRWTGVSLSVSEESRRDWARGAPLGVLIPELSLIERFPVEEGTRELRIERPFRGRIWIYVFGFDPEDGGLRIVFRQPLPA